MPLFFVLKNIAAIPVVVKGKVLEVAWTDEKLMHGFYEDNAFYTIKNTLSKIGLADVKAFDLGWKDCEAIMQNLGCKLEVKALAVA